MSRACFSLMQINRLVAEYGTVKLKLYGEFSETSGRRSNLEEYLP